MLGLHSISIRSAFQGEKQGVSVGAAWLSPPLAERLESGVGLLTLNALIGRIGDVIPLLKTLISTESCKSNILT